MKLNIAILGLSITSSWGNGHATTYRALVKALAGRGHAVTFIERDVSWYRDHRDLYELENCRIELYRTLPELAQQHGATVRHADLVIIGSYVPDGIAVSEWATAQATGVTAFYDIDTPVTLAGLGANSLDYLAPRLVPRFDLYMSFSGGPALNLVADLYGSPMVRPLYCSADPDLYHQTDAGLRWSLGYLGTYSDDRQPLLQALLIDAARQNPEQRFVVAGSKYPLDIEWPANVELIQHLAPGDHASFYGAQRYTLNVTRRDMKAIGFSPSVRLFEAASCGAPVISDSWRGLEKIFHPGSEILVARETRDVVEILRDLPEERRLAIAQAARARLLRDHTPAHRARAVEEYYQEAKERRKPFRSLRRPTTELEEAK